MTNTIEKTRVHRFRDKVAISTGGINTAYMSPAMAYELGRALQEYAMDIHNHKFTDSALGTLNIDSKGKLS